MGEIIFSFVTCLPRYHLQHGLPGRSLRMCIYLPAKGAHLCLEILAPHTVNIRGLIHSAKCKQSHSMYVFFWANPPCPLRADILYGWLHVRVEASRSSSHQFEVANCFLHLYRRLCPLRSSFPGAGFSHSVLRQLINCCPLTRRLFQVGKK